MARYHFNHQNMDWAAMRPFTSQQDPLNHPLGFAGHTVAELIITRPAKSTSEMTGLFHIDMHSVDKFFGQDLQVLLKRVGIDMDHPPPFEAVTANAGFTKHGVVKIGNIPFTVTVQEITQYLSRFWNNSPMLRKNEEGYPVHIIMEKPTGKTMDCYVEFPTYEAARNCVKQYEESASPARGTKLGSRNVNVELSDQGELMHAIFPRARLVKFDPRTGKPRILPKESDPSWSAGFRGYFTLEEIHGINKFTENPSRSPFVLKCNQRVYESLISTLYKYPWAETETYTVAARNVLFESVYKQIEILLQRLGFPKALDAIVPYQTTDREVGLSQGLLLDLLFAAINVPAFCLFQKFALCQAAGSYGRGVPLHKFAEHWPFQTILPLIETPDHVVKFWLELFDTGFAYISDNKILTSFEEYLVVSRNGFGYAVCEWTHKGVTLLFEDATRIETNVMMFYLNYGRSIWATSKDLELGQWSVGGMEELMQVMAEEKAACSVYEYGQQGLYDHGDNNISPTATTFNAQAAPAQSWPTNASSATSATSQFQGHQRNTSSASRFNPATAVDFVPSSHAAPVNKKRRDPVRGEFERLRNVARQAKHRQHAQMQARGFAQPGGPAPLHVDTQFAAQGQTGGFNPQTMAVTPFNSVRPMSRGQCQGFNQVDKTDRQRRASAYTQAPSYEQPAYIPNPPAIKERFPHVKYPPGVPSPLATPPTSYRQGSEPNTMSEQLRDLSLAPAPRNANSFSEYTSGSNTINTRETTPSTRAQSPGQTLPINEDDSPTPKPHFRQPAQVQHYPKLTYSNVVSGTAPNQMQPMPFGKIPATLVAQPNPTIHSAAEAANTNTNTGAAVATASADDKVRAQSIPYTKPGKSSLIEMFHSPTPSRAGSLSGAGGAGNIQQLKRGSLPAEGVGMGGVSIEPTGGASGGGTGTGAVSVAVNQANELEREKERKSSSGRSSYSVLGSDELWHEIGEKM